MTTYFGNGHYCYANVTAMLLASIGERVAPELVEVLPVAARRALDFPTFFEESRPGDDRTPCLAALKREQASLFGRSHTLLVRQDWTGAADMFVRLAAVEDEFRDQLMAAQVQVPA